MLRNALQLFGVAFILSAGVSDIALAQTAAPASPQAAPQSASQATARPADAQLRNAAPSAGGKKSKPHAPASSSTPASSSNGDSKQPSQAATPSQESAAPAAPTPGNAAPAAAISATGATSVNQPAEQKASGEAKEPQQLIWPFAGMTGYVDKQAAQRGFQIYSQVCSACHSMDLVSYRDLKGIGFSEAEIKAIAADKQVNDLDDSGQPVQRKGKPSDHFVAPFPNTKAAAAANGGAAPPDLSLMVKAREHGPDYIYSILTGFGNAPASETPVANKYYNPYFTNHWISMPPPLHDGAVTYQDGTTASVDQMARDVVTFLQWAAEPEMEARHEMGLKVLVYLLILTIVTYIAKKRVWKKIKH